MKTTAEKTTINTGVNNLSSAIIAELETRKDRSAWNKGVTEYAIELAESLDDWEKQPERLCSPSELKRVTNKNGLRDYPNSCEHWLDVQARALNQAARRVISIAAKYLSK